ncbi:MAG TPA: ABC transporter permease [Gaiellales bacterium]|nr:ABC transporter permease [Gaiellales bacterium]
MAIAVAEGAVDEVAEHRGGFRRRWYRTPSFVAGVLILGTIVAMCVAAPVLTSQSPTHQDLNHILASPSAKHPLGTDQLGRDVFSRILYGGRVDLRVAFLAVLLPFIIGTTLGCISGYYGRFYDTTIMRLVDVVVAIPVYVLIIAMVFVLGPGARSIYIAITFVGWVSYARIIRGEILVAKRQEYILAARAAGFRDGRIITRHLLPNVITQAIVYAMSDIVLDILFIVTLGYFGLGIQPPVPDWGGMIADGQAFLTTSWELSTIPGVVVVITALGLSLIGDGLADLLRPE